MPYNMTVAGHLIVIPYGVGDFVFWVAVAVVGGIILGLISYVCKRASGWLGSIYRLSEDNMENRRRIEELERKVEELGEDR
jgi:hypothetical protein